MIQNKSKPSGVRKRIFKAVAVAEAERQQKLLRHRLELVRTGVDAYEKKQITQAVTAFQGYLRLLEESKNVSEGGLKPALFDLKKDQFEVRMLIGIYWDLIKLYDHAVSETKYKEFLEYFEKYLLFAKEAPFQTVCADMIKRYMNQGYPVHKDSFQNAYSLLSHSRCFVVSSLQDVTLPSTLEILRKWRDEVLMQHGLTRMMVELYYHVGPILVRQMNRLPPEIRKRIGGTLDRFADWICDLRKHDGR